MLSFMLCRLSKLILKMLSYLIKLWAKLKLIGMI